jgi:hypothetical protein
MLMESRLKSHFVYGMVAFLAACQTPPASNQGSLRNEPAALNGQSDSRSSPYETEDFNPFQQSEIQWSHGGVPEGRDKRNRPAREPDAISNAIGHTKFYSRSHYAVIRVFDETGNVIETHEQAGEFRELWALRAWRQPSEAGVRDHVRSLDEVIALLAQRRRSHSLGHPDAEATAINVWAISG